MTKQIWLMVVLGLVNLSVRADTPSAHEEHSTDRMTITRYADLKWEKMLPKLGESSPEMSVLHEFRTTKGVQILLRTPKAIHIRKHWHSSDESVLVLKGAAAFGSGETRVLSGGGSLAVMPAKMVHEAWFAAGAMILITSSGAWDIHWTEGEPTEADIIK